MNVFVCQTRTYSWKGKEVCVEVKAGPMYTHIRETADGSWKADAFRPESQGGSPIKRAGIQKGWLLSSVDGKNLRSLSSEDSLDMIQNTANKDRVIGFTPSVIELGPRKKVEGEIDVTIPAGSMNALIHEHKGLLYIEDLKDDSAIKKAGVPIGWQITSFNGMDVTALSHHDQYSILRDTENEERILGFAPMAIKKVKLKKWWNIEEEIEDPQKVRKCKEDLMLRQNRKKDDDEIDVKLEGGEKGYFKLGVERGDLVIKMFRPEQHGGSPVAQAGVEVGWKIVSQNGKCLAGLSLDEVNSKIKLLSNQVRTLGFIPPPLLDREKDEDEIEVEVPRGPMNCRMGLTEDDFLMIEAFVTPRTPIELAGVEVSWIVVSLNGKDLETESGNRAIQLLTKFTNEKRVIGFAPYYDEEYSEEEEEDVPALPLPSLETKKNMGSGTEKKNGPTALHKLSNTRNRDYQGQDHKLSSLGTPSATLERLQSTKSMKSETEKEKALPPSAPLERVQSTKSMVSEAERENARMALSKLNDILVGQEQGQVQDTVPAAAPVPGEGKRRRRRRKKRRKKDESTVNENS
eukprot:g1943.t1